MVAEPTITLPPAHRRVLQRAVTRLEHRGLAAQLADYAGQPVSRVLRRMPQFASDRFNKVVQTAILNCLNVAIHSIEPRSRRPPARRASSMLAGISGGVGGFFGIAALPLELPVTTTLMLRAIADIARHYGEDLSTLEARLACVEVFALAPQARQATHLGYYASRIFLGRLSAEATTMMLERGAATLSTPVMSGFISEIATRYGIVVSERSAASAMPVLGALGGAAVNVIFMNHFQSLAQGHFVIRRLERLYGPTVVRQLYEEIAQRSRPKTRWASPPISHTTADPRQR
jgi:hypothetical protein